MTMELKTALKTKVINGWPLFWLISLPISAMILMTMLQTDLSGGAGVSDMIGYSVRWAIPFIYIVAAASSFQILFPGPLGKWWMRNRKFLGLCFAVAMAWQGLFIFIISTLYRDYYFDQIYYFRDELEGTIGYIFLVAMVVTSFKIGRKYVDATQWKLVHKSGVYFLWAYAFSVYWWNLFYYPTLEPYSSPRMIDYLFFWGGFLAFALRIAAWGKQRQQAAAKTSPERSAPFVFKAVGFGMIAVGVFGAVTGHFWREAVSTLIMGTTRSHELELWLPFWPLEPFIPLLLIGLGILIMTTTRSLADKPIRATLS